MIIDSHVHIVNYTDLPHKEGYGETLKLLFAQMKKSRVDHAFLMPDRKKEVQVSIDMESAVELLSDCKNIHLLGAMDVFKYTDQDLQQLEHFMARGQVRGLKLYPGYQHFYPANERCLPLYKLCLKYDLPLVFHSGATSSMNFPVKVKFAHPLHVDEVATDFPDLKIIIAHLGNPWLIDCAEVLYKNPNVYADVSGLFCLDQGPRTPYGKLMHQKITDLIAYAGASKLLYGTDWPVMEMKPYLDFVKTLPFSAREKERVFFKNAAELFKIKI